MITKSETNFEIKLFSVLHKIRHIFKNCTMKVGDIKHKIIQSKY